MLFVVLLSIFSVTLVRSALLSSPAELSEYEYDFVIIGGGTAGCVLANRLSENPSIKVLVIEAGGSNEGLFASIVPYLGVTLPRTAVDWNITFPPQAGWDGRQGEMSAGHVLGGSSSINLYVWNRGSNDMWYNWATITGDDGWSWASINKYFRKTSHLVSPADGHDTSGYVMPDAYGNGPVAVSLPGHPTQLDNLVISASKELGDRFGLTSDFNAGTTVGFGYIPSSIGEGKRSSAATAYLKPALNRSNLDVLIYSRAVKLLKSGSFGGTPVFNSVQIQAVSSQLCYQITARKEIILSAGTLGTPKLLQLSGIGSKHLLNKLGITTILDLPSVGQNLTDHPMLANYFKVNSENGTDSLLRNPALFAGKIEQWKKTGQGLMVNSPANTYGYMRLPDEFSFPNDRDPSSGPSSAHTEIIIVDGFAPTANFTHPETGFFMSFLSLVVSPLSVGSVTLASSDPFEPPIVDPNYYAEIFDLLVMVQAMKDVHTISQARAFEGFVLGPWGELAEAVTDEQKVAYARKNSYTGHHPTGTAKMSPYDAKWGVVNPDLMLKGAYGLRIVDASIFASSPECHPQAVVYTVAERAADLIKIKYELH